MRRFVEVAGEVRPAEQGGFSELAAPWSEYLLSDGTLLRVRPVLTDVVRFEDDDGQPRYSVWHELVAASYPPPEEER